MDFSIFGLMDAVIYIIGLTSSLFGILAFFRIDAISIISFFKKIYFVLFLGQTDNDSLCQKKPALVFVSDADIKVYKKKPNFFVL